MIRKRVKVLAPIFTKNESFRLKVRNGNGERAIHEVAYHSQYIGSFFDKVRFWPTTANSTRRPKSVAQFDSWFPLQWASVRFPLFFVFHQTTPMQLRPSMDSREKRLEVPIQQPIQDRHPQTMASGNARVLRVPLHMSRSVHGRGPRTYKLIKRQQSAILCPLFGCRDVHVTAIHWHLY